MCMFNFFKLKKRCNHCNSTKLIKVTECLKGYSIPVIKTKYVCSCGAESSKTKVYKKNEKIKEEHKNVI